jgi:hypothetical protein
LFSPVQYPTCTRDCGIAEAVAVRSAISVRMVRKRLHYIRKVSWPWLNG